MKKTEISFSLKDMLFNKKNVAEFADNILRAHPKFDHKSFQKEVLRKFPDLELKERIEHMVDQMEKYLTTDYKKNLKIILESLPPELDPTKTDNDFGRFIWIPFSTYIARNGCSDVHFKISLDGLAETTKRFSAEGDVRFFINKFPEETFEFMKKMSKSKNYHQRRLASEGFRPKLPWCIGIDYDYKTAGDILDDLFHDKTRYVTRSVANHLNDISKIDPEYVLEKLKKWESLEKQAEKEIEFIKNHALRTSVKNGHKETLKYLGYGKKPKLSKVNFSLSKEKVKIGGNLEFNFTARSETKQDLLIDYKIYFQTKSGKLSPKVFKIKKGIFKKGDEIDISKKYSFALKTTKAFYPGEHKIELVINGKVSGEKSFTLT